MKVNTRLRRGRIESADVFASYHFDGDEEWIFFKLIPWKVVRNLAKAMKQMRLIDHYTLDQDTEEPQRNGYLTKKVRMLIRERDEGHATVNDLKLIISEMVYASGYELHWLPVNRLLNFRDPMNS